MYDDDFNTSRRQLLRAALAGTGVGLLAGCDALSNNARFVDVLGLAEPLSQRVQRALTGNRLAAEFPESMISPLFRPNGSINPQTPEYLALKHRLDELIHAFQLSTTFETTHPPRIYALVANGRQSGGYRKTSSGEMLKRGLHATNKMG